MYMYKVPRSGRGTFLLDHPMFHLGGITTITAAGSLVQSIVLLKEIKKGPAKAGPGPENHPHD
jgi:hypothetical protein